MRSFRHGTGEASLAGLRDDGSERFGVRAKEVPGLWEREPTSGSKWADSRVAPAVSSKTIAAGLCFSDLRPERPSSRKTNFLFPLVFHREDNSAGVSC